MNSSGVARLRPFLVSAVFPKRLLGLALSPLWWCLYAHGTDRQALRRHIQEQTHPQGRHRRRTRRIHRRKDHRPSGASGQGRVLPQVERLHRKRQYLGTRREPGLPGPHRRVRGKTQEERGRAKDEGRR
uniref:Putative secreted protein n=1 Tax=Ixodes ricinus TaxID=34613 RepID=A0A6B0UQC1_IXORI